MVFFSILALGGGAGGQSPHVLVPKNTCKGIIDNTCDIGDFRAHIFCPQTTQELYLRSTMKQDRLNNCLLMRCHKSITDTLATMKIAKRFACANEQRKGHLKKNLSRGMSMAEWKMSALPPPPPRIAISSFWTTGASFARDVTAAILVVKNNSISLRGELNSIFKWIIRKNWPPTWIYISTLEGFVYQARTSRWSLFRSISYLSTVSVSSGRTPYIRSAKFGKK